MRDTKQSAPDSLLTVAFWANLLLAIVALILALLFLLLLLGVNSPDGLNPGGILTPLWYALLSWFYLDVLARERNQGLQQRPVYWLIAIVVAGFFSLGFFTAALLQFQHPPHAIFLLPLGIGWLSFFVVCRRTWRGLRR